jgi:hypothetical protein
LYDISLFSGLTLVPSPKEREAKLLIFYSTVVIKHFNVKPSSTFISAHIVYISSINLLHFLPQAGG